MDEQSLYHFCKCQYQLYEVPIRIYRGGRLVMKFDDYNIGEYEDNRDAVTLRTLSGIRNVPVYFNIQQALLLEGAVFHRPSDTAIWVGFARPVRITESITRRHLRDMGVNDLPKEAILRMHSYMNNLPMIAPGLFAVILSALNTFVNDSIVEPRDIFESNLEADMDAGVSSALLSQREERYFGGENNQNAYDMEQRILFLVKHGMTEELQKITQTAGFTMIGDAANPDAWRMTKDRCVVGIALVSRTAVSAGLPEAEAMQLCDLYIQKAELCKTGRSLNAVRYDMLLDFTERVAELRLNTAESRVVKSVSGYIVDHLEEKISLADLAERFSVNKNYLCKLFHSEMGMSVTEFTNYHKVNMAKQMLRFTDKPLIEISNYLNFCSQSYFQQVFKKQTGLTPTEYRNNGSL